VVVVAAVAASNPLQLMSGIPATTTSSPGFVSQTPTLTLGLPASAVVSADLRSRNAPFLAMFTNVHAL
jgi:hypothetical protein